VVIAETAVSATATKVFQKAVGAEGIREYRNRDLKEWDLGCGRCFSSLLFPPGRYRVACSSSGARDATREGVKPERKTSFFELGFNPSN
jgi:hypothetical protein